MILRLNNVGMNYFNAPTIILLSDYNSMSTIKCIYITSSSFGLYDSYIK